MYCQNSRSGKGRTDQRHAGFFKHCSNSKNSTTWLFNFHIECRIYVRVELSPADPPRNAGSLFRTLDIVLLSGPTNTPKPLSTTYRIYDNIDGLGSRVGKGRRKGIRQKGGGSSHRTQVLNEGENCLSLCVHRKYVCRNLVLTFFSGERIAGKKFV